ncbi:LLM class flavin-dependent oxidoreductase [Brevibacterium album]|uniref:LLM class flavin-dependent oxidoreductase n=1 Tax=Brevibacterium album TaxID=417948 RepID=UPI00042178BC|nr:LLM class flavin-dependent oxidoreductase [Brevibacterium album]
MSDAPASATAPTAVRLEPGALADPPALREAVRALDAAGVRWIVLGDDGASGADALTAAAWLGPATTQAVLVPEVPVTHTEPFHVATATATLDHVSRGRGGWSPVVQTTEAAARLTGRRPVAPLVEAWREAAEIDEVVTRLWTSWEPDAEIRDVATARFLDREKVHYVDFAGTDSVGEEFTVKGPSIVPRPPQGELPALVTADSPEAAEAALAFADLVLLLPDAGISAAELGERAAARGRSPHIVEAGGPEDGGTLTVDAALDLAGSPALAVGAPAAGAS